MRAKAVVVMAAVDFEGGTYVVLNADNVSASLLRR